MPLLTLFHNEILPRELLHVVKVEDVAGDDFTGQLMTVARFSDHFQAGGFTHSDLEPAVDAKQFDDGKILSLALRQDPCL